MESELIDNVKKFPVLYDRNKDGFNNKLAKENAWVSISADLGDTVDECEARWRNLRARYALEKRIKRLGNMSGTSHSNRPQWRWLSRMSFMAPHVRGRRTSANIWNSVSSSEPEQKALYSEIPSLPQEDVDMGHSIEDKSVPPDPELEVTSPTVEQPELHESEAPRLSVREWALLEDPKVNQLKNEASPEEATATEAAESPCDQETQNTAIYNAVLDTCQIVTSHFKNTKPCPQTDDPDLIFGKCVGMLLKNASPTTKLRKMKKIMAIVFEDVDND